MIDPRNLDTLLHPQFDAAALKAATPAGKGLGASPGAACGKIVFTADDAVQSKFLILFIHSNIAASGYAAGSHTTRNYGCMAFFEEDRIAAFREMICADTVEEREAALDKILPYQQGDFEKLYAPRTVRIP